LSLNYNPEEKEVEEINKRKTSFEDDPAKISFKYLNSNNIFEISMNNISKNINKEKLEENINYFQDGKSNESNSSLFFVEKKDININLMNSSTKEPQQNINSKEDEEKNIYSYYDALNNLKSQISINSEIKSPNKLDDSFEDDDDFSLMHSQSESFAGHLRSSTQDESLVENSLRKCSSIFSKLEEKYRKKSSNKKCIKVLLKNKVCDVKTTEVVNLPH